MSTTASVAQFMAILSGGTNPSTLRQGQNGTNSTIDFESFLSALPTGDQNLVAQNNAALSTDINSELSDGSIWQFIQQQVNNGGSNQLVLNLSEKGISDDTIQALQSIFGENDLVTILRDPKLNAQLDNALSKLSSATNQSTTQNIATIDNNIAIDENGKIVTVDTNTAATDGDRPIPDDNDNDNADVVISIISGILNQNSDRIQTTLTFSVDEEKTVQEMIVDLLGDQSEGAILVDTQKPVKTNSLDLALIQSGDQPLMQSASLTTNSANPFTLKSPSGEPTIRKGIENSLANATNNQGRSGEVLQSIADRVAATNTNSNNQSGARMDFASVMTGMNIDSVVMDGGEFAFPFEAAFKTATQAANPITSQSNATQAHPATQALALSLTKVTPGKLDAEGMQRYRLRLDPPELGRLNIEIDFADDTGKVKAVIMAEKPETLGLLQRDMHTLLKAMQDAGFENISNNDLQFSLSQDNANMGGDGNNGQNGNGHNQANAMDEHPVHILESEMSLIIDPATGQRSVNMLV